MNKYITLSLELHLFFARIMKEHSLFLMAGFSAKDKGLIETAKHYKEEFEKLLSDVVDLSSRTIRPNILNSGEIVTEYTLSTEDKTEELTGITIDKDITLKEYNLNINNVTMAVNVQDIKNINQRALSLVSGLISFKEDLLNEVITCNKFTANYPLLIDHITREAKLYRSYILALENGQDIEFNDIQQTEMFWNQIMLEHALFIRGLLDPTENELISTADNFAREYQELLKETMNMTDATMASIKNKTLQETIKYRDFKAAGTKGLDSCQIRSIILPLLADHVLREANHYLRILKK